LVPDALFARLTLVPRYCILAQYFIPAAVRQEEEKEKKKKHE
jgi:hypothetical protein